MSDCTYRMTIKNGGDSRAAPIISKVIHFPAAELAIIIGEVTLGDTGLMTWSTEFRKYQDIVRDDVELEINNAGQTTRKIIVKEASVLSYNETYDATDGLGRFELVIQRHFYGEQEYFYIPVKQKDGGMKHIVYRLDTLCLESLNELTLHWSNPAKKADFGKPISPNNPFFTDESRAAPLNLSFSVISWDRETIYGQLKLDLTAYTGREFLGYTRAAIQDRIGQLIADGYGAKYATAEGKESTRTVGGNTVKCHLAQWYRITAGAKWLKVAAPRMKLVYNNINPKATKGSGIPGLLEFVGGAAAASTAPDEAMSVAEAAVDRAKILKHNRIKGRAFEQLTRKDLNESDEEDITEQITLKSKKSGGKTRMDFLSKNPKTGLISLTEAKSSDSAPLTRGQKVAHPQIEQEGAVVVGKGKPPFVGGTEIPPTKVRVVRPNPEDQGGVEKC